MIRQLSAIAVSMLVSVTPVIAQDSAASSSELLVQAASAAVHRYPSVGSPVIGQATRGTTLVIKRNLGSWVEVSWANGESGTAFLHVNSGTISHRAAQSSGSAQAAIAQISAVAAAATSATSVSADARANGARMPAPPMSSARDSYVMLPSHRLGVGALTDRSKPVFGATTRVWFSNSVGIQFNLAQPQLESQDGRRLKSTQFAPSAMFSMPDAVTNAMWLRPYVGAGPRVYRATLENQIGWEAFGGAEATLAGLPQLAVSADIAYRWRRPSFDGFEPKRIGFALSAHWYVK